MVFLHRSKWEALGLHSDSDSSEAQVLEKSLPFLKFFPLPGDGLIAERADPLRPQGFRKVLHLLKLTRTCHMSQSGHCPANTAGHQRIGFATSEGTRQCPNIERASETKIKRQQKRCKHTTVLGSAANTWSGVGLAIYQLG